jgi:hypothetical protein
MKRLLILAAAASLAVACHNRSEDEVGAAPKSDTTTAVTRADTSRGIPTDSTQGQRPGPTDTSMVAHDSTSMGTSADSATVPSSAGNQQGDSAMTHHNVPDSASAGAGAAGGWSDSTGAKTDSTSKQ